MDEHKSAQLPFSERDFYLGEFRGRTMAIAGCRSLPLGRLAEPAVAALCRGGARVVLLSSEKAGLPFGPGVEVSVWRALSRSSRAEVRLEVNSAHWPRACAEAVLRFGISKWVWLDPAGGLERAGKLLSFVNHAELRSVLDADADPRGELWDAIDFGLEAGIAAINVCTPEGLEDELFTYAGSGTLFTRERYVSVRALGLDDYDAAADLLARGGAEGYLAQRTESERDRLLAHGFGAFVEDEHLAGIGSLFQHSSSGPAEIAGLYTLTRFLGEGIGGHLVSFAKAEAARRGFPAVFACTTSERVGAFFERNGFRRVSWRELPREKWHAGAKPYDEVRRESLLCFMSGPAPR